MCDCPFDIALRNARVSERTLQLWIKRFNEQGIDGLTYRPRLGRPRLLKAHEVEKKILPLVDDPTLAGEAHWTAVKLCGWLRDHEQLELSYPTLVRYLHEKNFARRIPRPIPEPPHREAWKNRREDFAHELLDLLDDPANKVFFGDEAGFEGDPRPRQRWVKRGSRPPKATLADTSGKMSLERSIQVMDNLSVLSSLTVTPKSFKPFSTPWRRKSQKTVKPSGSF